jgi:hypothetical protein
MRPKLVWVDRENVETPVYFASRATSKAEKNYPTTALECLSVVYFVTLFNFSALDASLLRGALYGFSVGGDLPGCTSIEHVIRGVNCVNFR